MTGVLMVVVLVLLIVFLVQRIQQFRIPSPASSGDAACIRACGDPIGKRDVFRAA